MLSEKNAEGGFSERFAKIFERANRLSFGALDIFRYAIRRFSRARGGEGAASIAFFTIFSLFPLLLVLVALGSFILESKTVQKQVLDLVRLTLPISPQLILSNIEQVLAERSAVGFIGLIGLAWSASGVLTSLIRNIDRAWPIAKPRNFLQDRLVALGIIAGLGGLLGLSTVTNAILSLLKDLDVPFITEEPLWRILSKIVPLLLVFLVFLGMYRWVPNINVSWKAAFWGAFLASCAWEISTSAFTWYLQSGWDQFRLIYGSLGTIVALMLWIYMNCLILLFCAHLSAAIVHHKDKEEGEE